MKTKRILSALLAGCMLLGSTLSGMSATAAGARVSVHDPSVFKDANGTYYVFGSHIDAARSNDLQNWYRFTNGYATTNNVIFGNLSQNLAGAFAWAGENLEDCEGGFSVWAPDVIYNPDYVNKDGTKGAYMMYFCTTSTYMRSVLAFGVSQKPEGPYQYVDTLIYSGFTSNDSYATSSTKNVNRKYTSTNIDELMAAGQVTWNDSWFRGTNFNNQLFPNAIDSTIYYDTDGRMYMTYGSWSGGIFTIELDKATGKCIHPKTGTTSDGRMVDSYFGTKISGGYGKSGEGPFMEYNPETGYYYLWVTYGGLAATGGYNMRVFRSTSPTGPFVDAAGRPAVLEASTNLDSIGLKVMGNYKFSCLNTAYMAPGHNSVLRDDDGQWYLLYHTRFNQGTEYHEVRVHSMYFSEDGWPVVAPFEYCGERKAEYGYETADIVGDYEYINHGNATNGNVINYQNIKLNADGTISGDVSGTWQQAEDSSEATLTIGGQKYTGHFLAAENEAGRVVMSFTAVGSNNQTIWGAKTAAYTGTERAPLIDYTSGDYSLVYDSTTVSGYGESVLIGETNLLSGVSYLIKNKNSGLALDYADGNVHQWSLTGKNTQEWRIVAEKDGYCRIVSLADETKCIAVDGSSADDGLNVEIQTFNGADNQLWKIVRSGLYYGIVSKCSGDAAGLDVFEWSTDNGGNVNQWEYWEGDCQLWQIDPVHPMVPDGQYTIRNLNSSLFIADDNGNAVQSDAETWTFTRQNDGTYTVQNADGLALTVENGSAEDGANMMLSALTGDKSQKFTLQCNKDGSYSLLTAASGGTACADVYEISMNDGANICQWNYWGGAGQKFVLEPVAEETEPPTTEPTTEPTTVPTTEPTTAPTTEPTTLPTTEPTTAPSSDVTDPVLKATMYGDVNEDGSVSIVDVIKLNRNLMGSDSITPVGKLNADVTLDDIVNPNDSLMILKSLVDLMDLPEV